MGILEATHTSYPIWEIYNNIISDNSAENGGGGISIQCNFPAPGHKITNNTITGNSANTGGALALYLSAYPVLTNTILWDNSAPEIYVSEGGGEPTVNYSDIMGGWPGIGNINLAPEFIYPDQSDYRLNWGSPCIDSGNPAPQYNDPDGTVADMGAFFYDQSLPVRVLLTPHGIPIQIPAIGGSFEYTRWATNIDLVSQVVSAWCDVTMPSGTVYGPTLGPVSITLNSGLTIDRVRTQAVPVGAPAGMYSYNAYAVAGSDTSTDSFSFVKLGAGGMEGLDGWFNTGDSFGDIASATNAGVPETYSLDQNYPNPFNPVTTIRFSLPEASWVTVEIFDVCGRSQGSPLQGWRDAGAQEVIFDGSNLASGIYVYRLQAGQFTASGKMVLMK